jgi:hypothetical protein
VLLLAVDVGQCSCIALLSCSAAWCVGSAAAAAVTAQQCCVNAPTVLAGSQQTVAAVVAQRSQVRRLVHAALFLVQWCMCLYDSLHAVGPCLLPCSSSQLSG